MPPRGLSTRIVQVECARPSGSDSQPGITKPLAGGCQAPFGPLINQGSDLDKKVIR